MTARGLLIGTGISGALAVALGAFGAHALAEAVPAERLGTWRTASTYHLVHVLAMGLSGVLSRQGGRVEGAGMLFLIGTLLFCGSLYGLVLLDMPILGAIAPLGGLAFIAGWVWMAWVCWREG
ncbi:MAG: DUF423 domain-containing protein [Bacteroidota bacterium]